MTYLEDLHSVSVYSLVSHTTREVYVSYSTSALVECAKTYELLRKGEHHCPRLQELYDNGLLELVEDVAYPSYDIYPPTLRGEYTSVLAEYRNAGYTDLRPEYSPGSYYLDIQVMSSPFDNKSPTPYVYVLAISSKRGKIVMGLFNTMMDAEDWCRLNFPDKSCIVPVFEDGELSRAYRDLYGYKLKE